MKPAFIILAALLLIGPAPAAGQKIDIATDTAPTRGTAANPEHVVFSISGGISLGAYQAGVNWMLLQAFQQVERVPSFPVRPVRIATVTGASAGNINTLFWAGELCRELPATGPLPGPESTLFWNLWVERADLSGLLPDELPDSAELGLLNRSILVDSLRNDLHERFERSRSTDCRLPIGLTITSVRPDTLWMPKADRFPIQTQRFAAFFRAENDVFDGDRAIRFRDMGIKDAVVVRRFGLVYRLQPVNDTFPVRRVLDVVKASSSFPVAFSPVALPLDSVGTRTRQFMDGGIFDNNPVALALLLFRHEYRDPDTDSLPRPTILYVNPGRMREVRDSTRADSARMAKAAVPGGLTPAFRMLGGAVGSARQYELQLLARDAEIDAMNPRWVFSNRRMPLVGTHLGAFAAFIAHPFREHDFYVGIYDGLLLLARDFSNCRPDDRRCVAGHVETLMRDPALSIPPAALEFLRIMHEEEFGRADALERRCERADWSDLSVDARVALTVACALEMEEPQPACGAADVASMLTCNDGIQSIFAELSTRRAVFERCASACEDSVRRRESARIAGWIDDPNSAGADLLDRVLARLAEVERGSGREIGKSTGFEWLTETVGAVYYGSGLRPGQAASSLPPGSPSFWRLLPTSISNGAREMAIEARYDFLWSWFAPSLIYHYNEEPSAPAASYPNLGVAAGISTQWPFANHGIRYAINRWGVQGEMFAGELDAFFDGDPDPFPAIYGFADGLLGKLRVSYRYTFDRGRLHGGGRHGVMFGLNDVNGLLYWVGELARGQRD